MRCRASTCCSTRCWLGRTDKFRVVVPHALRPLTSVRLPATDIVVLSAKFTEGCGRDGAGHAYATIGTPGARKVTVDGQQFLPDHPDKPQYPVHFCRECAHEYHPFGWCSRRESQSSSRATSTTRHRPVRTRPTETRPEGTFGFLTPHPPEDPAFTFADREEDYPETWLEIDTYHAQPASGSDGWPRTAVRSVRVRRRRSTMHEQNR